MGETKGLNCFSLKSDHLYRISWVVADLLKDHSAT